MKKIITCLLAILGLTSACGQQNFENTDVKGFSELIADSNVVVLDVRTVSEFAEEHIQGAILIDQGQSDFVEKAKATLPIEKKIAVYCRSGRRSANAAGKLADVGYKCINLKGGIIAWKEADMPVSRFETEQRAAEQMAKSLGFEKTAEEGRFRNSQYEVWDVVPRNVLVDDEGDIFVVDAEIKHIE